MNPALEHLLLERLADDGEIDERAQDLVLSALGGQTELDAMLGSEDRQSTRAATQPNVAPVPPGAYLRSVSVSGFRGVGAPAVLQFADGPGLTLVVGRNGSGKSSFAEGLELLLTGENLRWEHRTKVWREGWRNLHDGGAASLSADLAVEGHLGAVTVRRSWDAEAELKDSRLEVTAHDGTVTSLEHLGWSGALSRYRPFLSYNELGSMFDEPKTMYDALARILGLEDIEELAETLRAARLPRAKAAKDVRDSVRSWVARLATVGDERARGVGHALARRSPDFDAIERALAGVLDGADPEGDLRTLRVLSTLGIPARREIGAAFDRWAAARLALAELSGSDAAHADRLAGLLDAALAHCEERGDPDCPVCGTAGALDDDWRRHAQADSLRLREQAQSIRQASEILRTARSGVADLAPPAPVAGLVRAGDVGLDADAVSRAWSAWSETRDHLFDPAEAEAALLALVDAITTLAADARDELERREDAWRPIATELASWLPHARGATAAAEHVKPLQRAETWVREAAAALRGERFAPIAQQADANWRRLRQESNVSIEQMKLAKAGNVRSAVIDVRVDGSDASAWGVMSQGELHSLAISVFLPRAALPESPFRFMVIDDPVQSMDPAKVDGLARVLAQAAETRQVIVFTHDERLGEAILRLNLPVTIKEVTRRQGSIVDVRERLTPVARYLGDARVLLAADHVPREVAQRVVPGLVRSAIEAACTATVRRRRLLRGERHVDVDTMIDQVRKLYVHLSLALFDDPDRGSEVLRHLNNKYGRACGDAVQRANKGSHELVPGDLRGFVRSSEELAHEILKLP